MGLQYTTTVAQETGNNTSVSWGGNVSNVSIKSVFPNAKVFVNVIPWHRAKPNQSHLLDPSGYDSDSLYQCVAQAKDIKRRGFDGVIISWQGLDETKLEGRCARRMIDACEAEGLQVCLMLDQTFIRYASGLDPAKAVQVTIDAINGALARYCTSPYYYKEGGKPVFFEFGFETLKDSNGNQVLDMAKVMAGLKQPINLVYRHPQGATKPGSTGVYGWVENGLPYIDWFIQQTRTITDKMVWGIIYPGFDNSLAMWSVKNGGSNPDKVIARDNGNTWLATINKNVAAAMKFVQVATWNDHEEGSGIEQGIDAGLTVSGQVISSLGSLNVKVTTGGNPALLHHLEYYLTQDNINLVPVAPVDINLLPTGDYSLYIKAVGYPCVKNVMSSPIPFTVPKSDAEIAYDKKVDDALGLVAKLKAVING